MDADVKVRAAGRAPAARPMPGLPARRLLQGGLLATAVCAVLAVEATGMERVLLGLTALFVGGSVALARSRGGSWEGPVRFVLGAAGVAVLLAGVAGVGLGLVLGAAGSYGLLAAFVVVPVGALVASFGWGLLRMAFAGTDDARGHGAFGG